MKNLSYYLLAVIGVGLIYALSVGCSSTDGPGKSPRPNPNPNPPQTLVVPAPEQIIMYEANPRLFGTSRCLNGIKSNLNRIQSLGTNVLWLMPICEFGVVKSIGSPYCIKNYTNVDPAYGTLDDLRMLVDAAHERGIIVILDWVANHTSWDNVWIENKDWYTQDSAGNIVAPAGTNWSDVADLNFDNRDMRRAMIDAMKYWISEADIDGYRCDAADWVPADFWAEAIAELRESFPDKEILMLAEGAEISNFEAGFDMNYAWNYYDALESVFGGQPATRIYETHVREYAAIPEDGVKLRFTTNHDKSAYNGTPIEIYGGREGSLAALAITTFMGGAPMLYSSQECAQSSALDFMAYTNYSWVTDTDYTAEVKRLMSTRKDNQLFSYGTTEDYSNQDVVMFTRHDSTSEAMVVVNVRNGEQSVTIPTEYVGVEMTEVINNETITLPEEVALGAYEYRIWIR